MDDVNDLMEHWGDSPPTHVAVQRLEDRLRAFMGAPARERAGKPVDAEPSTPEELDRFMDAVNAHG